MPTGTHDNVTLVDAGTGLPFVTRMKDVSVAQDGSVMQTMNLATLHPLDYQTGGAFQLASTSGVMAAGIAAASPIWEFRWTSATMFALLRRLRLSMWSLGTGFTAGIGTFSATYARTWTADDGGGYTETLTSNQAKLRSSMATSLAAIRRADTAALTAGTRTLDTKPFAQLRAGIDTSTNKVIVDGRPLFERIGSEHPVVLAQNEGVILAATVPATGTWTFDVTCEWEEVPNYG